MHMVQGIDCCHAFKGVMLLRVLTIHLALSDAIDIVFSIDKEKTW